MSEVPYRYGFVEQVSERSKGMAVETAGMKTEMLSLQSRIEQCEAAISTARGTLGKIEGMEESAEKEPERAGAMAAIDRCNSRMADLNERLSMVAEKVGSL